MGIQKRGGQQRVLVETRALSVVGVKAVLLFYLLSPTGTGGGTPAVAEAQKEAKREVGVNCEEVKKTEDIGK